MSQANVSPSLSLPQSGVSIRRVSLEAPWSWLAAGWRDLWTAPRVSLGYGLIFALLVLVAFLGLTQTGWQSLVLPLAGGIVLIGPIFAVGLYEISRRIEKGETVDAWSIVSAVRNAPAHLGFFGVVLAFAFFVWLEIAFLLLMLFMGTNLVPTAGEFTSTLLFTPHGRGLLVVGTIIGGILAAVVYAISVISVPLLMTRKIDVVSAMSASIEAIRVNPRPMVLWAALIAAFMGLGIATVLVGLVLAFPWIGHATWHAFRDLVADSDQ